MKTPQPRSRRQANLKMIAERTGVSLMTVSRTLHGGGPVAPATAEKIRKVAEELRYHPNMLVQGLRTGRTGLVATILPSSLGFYESTLRAIESSLDHQGSSVLLNLVSRDFGPEAMKEEIDRLHRCIGLRVDGIILRPVNDDANAIYFKEVVERGVPLVVIDRKLPDFPCDFVGTEDRGGGESAAFQLLARGCKNLVVLHAGLKVSTSRERREGFLSSVRESGVRATELDCGSFLPPLELLVDFFDNSCSKSIDGVFAVGDHLARAAHHAIRLSGRACPADIKIVGFGNLAQPDPGAPRIATFDQHPEQIGVEAVRLLTERLDNPGRPPRSVYLPAEFIPGDTL